MRKYRNISRLTVLILMVALVYLNLYEKKAGQLGAEEEISESLILRTYDLALGSDNKPMLFRGVMEGGLYSFRILALSLSDPLAFLSSTVAALELNLKLLLSILIPLGLLLLLGRFFCAWVCPYSLFAEAGQGLTRWLRQRGIEYFHFDLPQHSALFYLILSLVLGAALSLPIATLIYPPRILTEGIYHLVVSGMITSGLIFLIFLWLGEVIFSPHLFCRRLCPGGALFGLLGRWRGWRIAKLPAMCDMCGVCNPACPYDLKPALGDFPGACDNCGLCIDACKGNDRAALKYVWGFRSRVIDG